MRMLRGILVAVLAAAAAGVATPADAATVDASIDVSSPDTIVRPVRARTLDGAVQQRLHVALFVHCRRPVDRSSLVVQVRQGGASASVRLLAPCQRDTSHPFSQVVAGQVLDATISPGPATLVALIRTCRGGHCASAQTRPLGIDVDTVVEPRVVRAALLPYRDRRGGEEVVKFLDRIRCAPAWARTRVFESGIRVSRSRGLLRATLSQTTGGRTVRVVTTVQARTMRGSCVPHFFMPSAELAPGPATFTGQVLGCDADLGGNCGRYGPLPCDAPHVTCSASPVYRTEVVLP